MYIIHDYYYYIIISVAVVGDSSSTRRRRCPRRLIIVNKKRKKKKSERNGNNNPCPVSESESEKNGIEGWERPQASKPWIEQLLLHVPAETAEKVVQGEEHAGGRPRAQVASSAVTLADLGCPGEAVPFEREVAAAGGDELERREDLVQRLGELAATAAQPRLLHEGPEGGGANAVANRPSAATVAEVHHPVVEAFFGDGEGMRDPVITSGEDAGCEVS